MPKPTKNDLVAAHDAAAAQAAVAQDNVEALERALAIAKETHAKAAAEAESAQQAAFADEIAEAKRVAEENELRHKAEHAKHCHGIQDRKAAREAKGEHCCAHDKVAKMTIDGSTHHVVKAHGLLAGTAGFAGGAPREGSRYYAACGLTKDTPHDELDHECFDQGVEVDCPDCLALEVAPSDYLTAKEHIAHVRAQNAKANKASGRRGQ